MKPFIKHPFIGIAEKQYTNYETPYDSWNSTILFTIFFN